MERHRNLKTNRQQHLDRRDEATGDVGVTGHRDLALRQSRRTSLLRGWAGNGTALSYCTGTSGQAWRFLNRVRLALVAASAEV